jgi:hypothetical protein
VKLSDLVQLALAVILKLGGCGKDKHSHYYLTHCSESTWSANLEGRVTVDNAPHFKTRNPPIILRHPSNFSQSGENATVSLSNILMAGDNNSTSDYNLLRGADPNGRTLPLQKNREKLTAKHLNRNGWIL